jgi:adenosylmethionine-8-amino-7-oxononanoate aminotransferase
VAAAALANIGIIEREHLCGRALELEAALLAALAPLADHELVDEVRGGFGVLAAVQVSAGALAADATLPARISAACRAAGVLVRTLLGGAIAVSPPLVIDDDGLDELASGLRTGLDDCR